jgi:hypothetical protein
MENRIEIVEQKVNNMEKMMEKMCSMMVDLHPRPHVTMEQVRQLTSEQVCQLIPEQTTRHRWRRDVHTAEVTTKAIGVTRVQYRRNHVHVIIATMVVTCWGLELFGEEWRFRFSRETTRMGGW